MVRKMGKNKLRIKEVVAIKVTETEYFKVAPKCNPIFFVIGWIQLKLLGKLKFYYCVLPPKYPFVFLNTKFTFSEY